MINKLIDTIWWHKRNKLNFRVPWREPTKKMRKFARAQKHIRSQTPYRWANRSPETRPGIEPGIFWCATLVWPKFMVYKYYKINSPKSRTSVALQINKSTIWQRNNLNCRTNADVPTTIDFVCRQIHFKNLRKREIMSAFYSVAHQSAYFATFEEKDDVNERVVIVACRPTRARAFWRTVLITSR